MYKSNGEFELDTQQSKLAIFEPRMQLPVRLNVHSSSWLVPILKDTSLMSLLREPGFVTAVV
jgi:hypothetical protein